MKKNLMQVIVNTKGQARTVAQTRDKLGRFMGKASVGGLVNPRSALLLANDSDCTVVVVQHSLFDTQQTVSSVNRETRTGNSTTFLNDGTSNSLKGSIYS
jgi:hypothetical protein